MNTTKTTLNELVKNGYVQVDKNKKEDYVYFNSPNNNFQFEFKQSGTDYYFISGKTLSKYYKYSEILK